MRSRYLAYALGRVEHIIGTTDPEGPMWESDLEHWSRRVHLFCVDHDFLGLDVLSASIDAPDRGRVLFRAHIHRGREDVSFAELSLFVRREGRWLYHSGDAA